MVSSKVVRGSSGKRLWAAVTARRPATPTAPCIARAAKAATRGRPRNVMRLPFVVRSFEVLSSDVLSPGGRRSRQAQRDGRPTSRDGCDHPRDAIAQGPVGRLLGGTEEDVAVVDGAVDVVYVNQAQAALALAAVVHQVGPGPGQRLEHGLVRAYARLDPQSRDADDEVLGLEPAAVAEGLVAQVGRRQSRPFPGTPDRVHEADRSAQVELGGAGRGVGSQRRHEGSHVERAPLVINVYHEPVAVQTLEL